MVSAKDSGGLSRNGCMRARSTVRMAIDCFTRWETAMLDGDFENAWRITDDLERQRRRDMHCAGFQRETWHLLWNGTPVEGRDVVVCCRYGLGDSIQFLRYLPMLRARAKSVQLDIQPELRELFPSE